MPSVYEEDVIPWGTWKTTENYFGALSVSYTNGAIVQKQKKKELGKTTTQNWEKERGDPGDADSSVPTLRRSSGAFLPRELASCEKYWRRSRVTVGQKVMSHFFPRPTNFSPWSCPFHMGTFAKVAPEKRSPDALWWSKTMRLTLWEDLHSWCY